MIHHMLQRLPDGTFMDWGRNATVNGVRGQGGAQHYSGEAARVMDLVLKYSTGGTHEEVLARTAAKRP